MNKHSYQYLNGLKKLCKKLYCYSKGDILLSKSRLDFVSMATSNRCKHLIRLLSRCRYRYLIMAAVYVVIVAVLYFELKERLYGTSL